jgi:hypothetical protein
MIYPKMTGEEIEEMYADIHIESLGAQADNPWKYKKYFEQNLELQKKWPILFLCVDQEGVITWRMGCGNYNIGDWMKEENRDGLEEAVSKDDRPITFLELHNREGFFHIFPEKSENIDFEIY